MRTGKISENVLKRSVLRLIKNRREEVVKGAEVGGNCAFLSWGNTQGMSALSTQMAALPVKNAAYLAVMAACNNLAAEGARAAAVMLSLALPKEAPEDLLKEIMGQAERCCEALQVQIAGGHTEVSPSVQCPVITATAVGEAQEMLYKKKSNVSDMDIVMSKWTGLEGTAVLAGEKEADLLERFPVRLVDKAKKCEEYLSIASEAAIALKSGVYAMHDVRSGGIFGALWELSRKIDVGLTVNLKQIPIRQETIEICEFLGLNPYELLSGGSLLMVTENGGKLKAELENAGIFASVIGRTNGTNDKIIVNQDETRYLTMPAADEIYKFFFKEEDK